MIRRLLFSSMMLWGSASLAAGADGPDVEFLCPCTYSAASASSVNVEVGVINRGTAATEELIVRAYAHELPSYHDSTDREFLGNLRLTTGLEPGSQIDIAQHQMRLKQPAAGSYYVTLLLLEDNFIMDLTRTGSKVDFGKVPANTFSDLYFMTDPVVEIDGDSMTLDFPGIGNSGSLDETTEISVLASTAEDFFSGSVRLLAEYAGVKAVAAGEQSESETVQFDITPPGGDFPFVHVVVTDGEFTTLLHTVVAPDVVYDDHNFAAASADFLTDSDGDGVADDNELLAGTDGLLGNSTPGKSYIDILAVYSTGVKSHYDGDPSARIEHLIAVSNAALEDSGVDIVFRVVGIEDGELAMDTTREMSDWLSAAGNGDDIYSDLQARRETAGADLVTMFRLYDGNSLCGLATLGGFATQGLLTRTEHISASFIEFDECGDLTMIHEIGHNMGLGHSARQNETGTFTWSRGHGVDDRFATIMAYASEFNLFSEAPFFSSPTVSLCDGLPCGVSIAESDGANSASSLNAVRFQVAAFQATAAADEDGDGVPDDSDAFPEDPDESVDTDGDGLGDNADYDDDNDGMPDSYELAVGHDPLFDDASADANSNDISNLDEYLAIPKASQFLQTNSVSANISRLHIVNTSDSLQEFTGTLYQGSGARLGAPDQALGSAIEPKGRLVLTSDDLEVIFGVSAWVGPAMIEVSGQDSFVVMSKLESPSGLVSNTNCVREDRTINIEGFDSGNMTFVRFINTGNGAIGSITGTLYDSDGNVIGSPDVELVASLAPKGQVFVNRNNFAEIIGSEWQGEAMLEVAQTDNLKLLNLNFANAETFFNFSCFENSESGRVYLQTNSTSSSSSLTHIVNTGDAPQQFTGTLYGGDGVQLGDADTPLHDGMIAAKGRLVLSSQMIENALSVGPWEGPAMLEVNGSGTFELMTKLSSPSGLVSNTNCVRRDQVHNIEGADYPDRTYVRFINIGSSDISPVIGTLYDPDGAEIGEASQTLRDSLGAKEQIWITRDQLSDLFGGWNGEAMLSVEGGNDLRLLNLNFINSETFFNFSCYESSGYSS